MPAHRTPESDARIRDADRTKRCLLDAAFDEFSARGFAGARVGDIADRAGVNKQLITYYFGGKAGLYRALQQRWLERESEFADPELPLADLAVRYLQHALADPRGIRMLMWRGLFDEAPETEEATSEDLAEIGRRQRRGEIAAELDPASVRLAVMAMVIAPLLLPGVVRELFGTEARTPEFEQRYTEQLRRMVARFGTSTIEEGEDQ
ncbi:TetR/AcrR family transcriptional regulator [Nocardia sp. alder85J]|uniref:TetR/AcrR family transcriptional regulator n=1 Tax=Nocardia sp. alder85J TaxID=2862949 RepID=UPI001CD6FCF6|nr:TetR family transcriptional regulator [Nocardia sp. alder85J]MCX4093931.1 TetR family transcriptional regulator [Nocardia sp. alder85J]